MNFRLLLISIIPISVEKIELSAYTQKVSQQCSARYKRYGSCLKESNINASHPQQMPFCCEEGNKRASGGGGGGGLAKRLRRRERVCVLLWIDCEQSLFFFS